MNKRTSYFMMIIFIIVFGSFAVIKLIASGGIHQAVDDGNMEKIEKILKKNPQLVNKKGEFGWTPLHKAAYNGNIEAAKLLIKMGAEVNAKDPRDSAPIHICASSKDVVFNKNILSGRIEIIKLLVSSGADIDAANDSGETALHIASKEGSKKIVNFLLLEKANLNARDNNNKTPLDLATEEENSEIIQSLNNAIENYKKDK